MLNFGKRENIRMENDILKEKYLSGLKDDDKIAQIVATFESDELKEKYLKSLGAFASNVIASLKNDELKLKYMNEMVSEQDVRARVDIVASLNSDDAKQKYLEEIEVVDRDDEYLDIQEERMRIITTFSNDELKLEYLESAQRYSSYIIASLDSDDLKDRFLPQIKSSISKTEIIASYKNDEHKMFAFENFLRDDKSAKAKILETLENDILKEEYLSEIKDDNERTKIIMTLKEDELKEKYLLQMEKDFSDKGYEDYRDYRDYEEFYENSINIISSFKDDEKKEIYLNKSYDKHEKAIIIASLKDDELKVKHLENIEDENDRTAIITSLNNNKLKVEYLEGIKEDKNIFLILTSIDNEENKTIKEALSYSMGADLHETWRETRKKEDGTYEPRMKKSKDEKWNKEHGTDDVDIANLTFEELPSNWQYENLEAAKVAIAQVFDKVIGGGEISEEMIETMSSEVHEAWLKRNDWVYDKEYGNPDQAKPYVDLSEEEKAKDRVQIQEAIQKVQAYVRGEIDINKLNEQYGLVHTKEKTPLEQKEAELTALEAEAKTISEAEALIDQQKEGQDIGEE